MRKVKRLAALICTFAFIFSFFSIQAFAIPPVILGSGYVTDQAGVLSSSDKSRAESALGDLNREHKIQVFVAFVDSFDGVISRDWADRTAINSGLGLNDLLLAVAVEDRQYAWSIDEDFPLTDTQLERVAADYIEPALQENDWAGATLAAAEGFDAVLSTTSGGSSTPSTPSTSTPSASSGSTTTTASSGSSASWIVPLILLLIVVAVIVFFVIRSRKNKGVAQSTVQPETLSTKDLGTRAGKLLVEVDDAIQSSEQELGFAEAEFGSEAVQEYNEVLKAAKKDVAEAFHLQQSVFDAIPEDDATKRQMLMRIIELATNADARLDEKAEGFAQLRTLAERVNEIMPTVKQGIAKHESTFGEAGKTLAVLKASYLPSALGEVADDDIQAADLLEFAKKTVAEAEEKIANDDKYAAAILVRSAENASAQIERLLSAVAAAKDSLEKATATLRAEIAQLEQAADSAEARSGSQAGIPVGSQAGSQLSSMVRIARDAANQARAALASPPFDPIAQLNMLRTATTQLTAVLETVERTKAAYATASATITSAKDRISAVDSFIVTRRGAVGYEARSSLQEAKNRLLRAEQLLVSDTNAALSEAQAAIQYADRASQWAQSNVESYNPSPFPGGGTSAQIPGGSPSNVPNIGSTIAGALIAGVLQDVLSGGGRSGSSGGSLFGGGSLGGGRSGGFSLPSIGGFSPSSFGGSGGRRGGGGRF